jgi:hypothetical protein
MTENINNSDEEKYKIIFIDEQKYYQCIDCDFYTKHMFSIKRHIETKEQCYLTKIKYKCPLCEKEFKKKEDLDKHCQKKKKCNIIENKVLNTEPEDILLLRKELDKLKESNNLLNSENEKLKNKIIVNENLLNKAISYGKTELSWSIKLEHTFALSGVDR